MSDWNREIVPWRQGHLLDSGTIKALGIFNSESPEKTAVIVISHDCDLVQKIQVEPDIEVIVGRLLPGKPGGNYAYSKNARKLHLKILQGSQTAVLELMSTGKRSISKKKLLGAHPDPDLKIDQRELTILQFWLAARYRRAAFPDKFNDWLKNETGMYDRIRRILKDNGEHIICIFFDVDNGEELVHNGVDDPFKLEIDLVYSTETDEEVAKKEADEAVKSIKEAFEKDQCRRWIELVGCTATADYNLSFALSRILKEWHTDDLSLRADD